MWLRAGGGAVRGAGMAGEGQRAGRLCWRQGRLLRVAVGVGLPAGGGGMEWRAPHEEEALAVEAETRMSVGGAEGHTASAATRRRVGYS